MFLGIEWFWWIIIVAVVIISIPFKIKFLKWYNNKSKAEKKDKWGDEGGLEFKNDFLKKPDSSYYKGMGQRVSMARVFINNPKLLFLDEPTSGLDPQGAVLFRKIIEDERKKGTTVILRLLLKGRYFSSCSLLERCLFLCNCICTK